MSHTSRSAAQTPSDTHPDNDVKPVLSPKRKGGVQVKAVSKMPRKLVEKSAWTPEDDQKVISMTYVQKEGINWEEIARELGGGRTANVRKHDIGLGHVAETVPGLSLQAVRMRFKNTIKPQFEPKSVKTGQSVESAKPEASYETEEEY